MSRGAVVLALLVGIAGCEAPAPAPVPDAELYDLALSAIAEAEPLDRPLWLHPLASRVDRDTASGAFGSRDFITNDSLVVAEIAAVDPDLYRICDINSTGQCQTPGGAPWIVVSELVPSGDQGRVLTVAIRHPSRPGPGLSTYVARLNLATWGGPSVRLERPR